MPDNNNYEVALEKVESALIKGEYDYCIEFLVPIIETYSISSVEGANLRTLLITALCATNQKEAAKKYCKELLKSNTYKVKEDAKYLIEIIDSPEIKKPDNWNIDIENNLNLKKMSQKAIKKKRFNRHETHIKRFINPSNIPTGETRSFQKGFIFIISLFMILLIPLLSS